MKLIAQIILAIPVLLCWIILKFGEWFIGNTTRVWNDEMSSTLAEWYEEIG